MSSVRSTKAGRVLIVALLASFVVTGCQREVAIDGSTEASFEQSMKRVREELGPQELEEFESAVMVIAMKDVDLSSLIAAGQSVDPSTLPEKLIAELDGKTAEQVIAEADVIRAERERKQKRQALAEIQELLQKKQAAEAAEEQLKAFDVVRSRFYIEDRDWGLDKPIIELTVKNGTNSAVSRAYFHGVVASPDRSVPWISEDFNYKISGGIEPGETKDLRMVGNIMSAWGNTDVPEDAVFTVNVRRIDGADGEALFNAEGFDKYDARRLESLRAEYGE